MFGFGLDRKTLIIIIAVMLVAWLLSAGTSGILSLLLSLPAVLIAITFHEYAHAWMADKLGDDTPRLQGRLSLNPFNHMDPLGIVLLIVAGFGWGKPVQIDSRNFNGKYSLSKAEAMVAAAGPIMNFILAFVFLIIINILEVTNVIASLSVTWQYILMQILIEIVVLNIGLGVFNLIPLPPLDGSKILMHFLSYNARNWFLEKQNMFYLIFILIWLTGISGRIITPLINYIYIGMNYIVSAIFSIF